MGRNIAAGSRSVTQPHKLTAALINFQIHLDERTQIRLLRKEDADALYDATVAQQEHLREFMTWPDDVIDVSDTYRFLRRAEQHAYEHTGFYAGTWAGQTLAGCIDLHDIDWNNAHAAIGYWLCKEYTGSGLMTRAVQALAEYAFDALDLHRIEIRVATTNVRSRAVPERLGFAFEGILHGVQRLRGGFVDHAVYALIRPD